MKNKRNILRFIVVFVISFIVIEAIELILDKFFGINLSKLEWGWIGFIIIYGFKYHIFCCLFPAIWAGYICRHKKCNHTHCNKDGNKNRS